MVVSSTVDDSIPPGLYLRAFAPSRLRAFAPSRLCAFALTASDATTTLFRIPALRSRLDPLRAPRQVRQLRPEPSRIVLEPLELRIGQHGPDLSMQLLKRRHKSFASVAPFFQNRPDLCG